MARESWEHWVGRVPFLLLLTKADSIIQSTQFFTLNVCLQYFHFLSNHFKQLSAWYSKVIALWISQSFLGTCIQVCSPPFPPGLELFVFAHLSTLPGLSITNPSCNAVLKVPMFPVNLWPPSLAGMMLPTHNICLLIILPFVFLSSQDRKKLFRGLHPDLRFKNSFSPSYLQIQQVNNQCSTSMFWLERIVISIMVLDSNWSSFEPRACHSITARPWASYMTTWTPSFLMYIIGIFSTSQRCHEH